MSRIVTIGLDLPPTVEQAARYAIAHLAAIIGIGVHAVPASPGCDAVYGLGQDRRPGCGGVILPYDPTCYDRDAQFGAVTSTDGPLWVRGGGSAGDADPIGATYRLLALLDESAVPDTARDQRGVFSANSLPASRAATRDDALVEALAARFKRILYPLEPGDALPRWPGGKRFAVALTHDTDATHLGAAGELLYNAGKWLLRRDPMRLRMVIDGLRSRAHPAGNPLFGFPRWRDLSARIGSRHCFFLFARGGGVARDVNDCRSSVVDGETDWDLLRSMADEGHEFGLHAPLKAANDLRGFTWGKGFIEERLGRPIHGLRHHYWALDWRAPYRTHRMHRQAGFTYDMSIAYRDATGFRSGSALPYRPFDPESGAALDVLVLPSAIMDSQVIRPGNSLWQAYADAFEVVERVRRAGGVLALNWHTETACNRYNYTGHFSVATALMAALTGDSDAWVATPAQIADHWRQRLDTLAPALNKVS